MTTPFSERLDRRTAIKWMATAAASATMMPRLAAQVQATTEPEVTIVGAYEGPGYGTDPDLLKDYAPGDLWPLTFDDQQRQTAAVLCGLIIPADARSPSAADLKIHDLLDEWVSSPYPQQAGDRLIILEGLGRLDMLAMSEYGRNFAELGNADQGTLCDRLAKQMPMPEAPTEADQELQKTQRFFKRFRELTAGAFFTTPEGLKDIGYRGNVPLAVFPKPPADLLRRLGLEVD